MKKVCIEMADDGSVKVGLEPPMGDAGNMGEESSKEYMQPAESVDAALDMAAQMLESDPAEEMANDSAFADGFKETMPGGERPKMG